MSAGRELTASGPGEPREAMGSPAVSRFLYKATIANKIRKSSETVAKKVYRSLVLLFECIGLISAGKVLRNGARGDVAGKPRFLVVRNETHMEVGHILVENVGVKHEERYGSLNDQCNPHFE